MKNTLILFAIGILLTSCFPRIYNKRDFKKINQSNSQNHLIKKNGYYFHETELYQYDNFVPYGTGGISTDSTLIKTITGIIFYDNSKVYVTMNYFDGLKYNQENSLKVAQNGLEKRIEEFDLKTLDKKKNHIATLGKYSIHSDTITIQYFRFSQGDRLLTEIKGIFKSNEQFLLFQKKDFQIPIFGFRTKPKIYQIDMEYKFKKY